MKPFDFFAIKLLICAVLFFAGAWVFNHFAYPFAGIVMACAYPCVLIYQTLRKQS